MDISLVLLLFVYGPRVYISTARPFTNEKRTQLISDSGQSGPLAKSTNYICIKQIFVMFQ